MWTLEKINQFIEEKIEENLYLDYKAADSLGSSDGKKNEIAKDVSAFANSDGGTIIYGVREYQSGTQYLPEKIDPLNRTLFSKETLEQIINSRISPRIHGIIITPVTIDELNVIYVVEIPKSNTAHQSSDKRYYRRYNFQSVMMDDWEIKDIIGRQNKSEATVSFFPHFNRDFYKILTSRLGTPMTFDIAITNVGTKAIDYCDCIIAGSKLTGQTLKPIAESIKGEDYFEKYYTNEIERKVTLEEGEFVVNVQRMPILPSTYRVVGEITFLSDFFIGKHSLKVTITLDDNRMTSKIEAEQLMQ